MLLILTRLIFYLNERSITFESQTALFAKIPCIVHYLYFPKKRRI